MIFTGMRSTFVTLTSIRFLRSFESPVRAVPRAIVPELFEGVILKYEGL